MSLRIPLTKDQTLQVEFHEIERRLRKLEKSVGERVGSTTVYVSGSTAVPRPGGTVDTTGLIARIEALELLVAGLSEPTETPVFKGTGDFAAKGLVPEPDIHEPPTGIGEQYLEEDATWSFPYRGVVQLTTPGDATSATDNLHVSGSLTVGSDFSARDVEAREVRTIDGVSLEGDSYQRWSDERGLVLAATDGTQTQPPSDTVTMLAGLHCGDIMAADVECFNLHTHGDIEYCDSFWDDLRIEPVARTTGSNAPSFHQYADDGGLLDTGSSRGVYLYSFDDAGAGSEKEIFFTMQMPHAWKVGSKISLHVHWIGGASDTTAAPRWGLEYTFKAIGQTFGATNTIYSTGVNVDASGNYDPNITAGKHYISEFAAIDPGATASGISAVLIARLFRNSANAADTYNVAGTPPAGATCGLLYIDAHYETDSPGSSSEYVK